MLGAVWQPDLILIAEQDFSMISLLMIVYSYEIFNFTTSSQKCPSPQPSPPSPSWTLLVSREGLPEPMELFKAQQEPSLTLTAPVCAGLSNSDEASPAIRAAPGGGVATGASAAVENPG